MSMITFPLPQLAKQNVQTECLILSCQFQLGMLLLTRKTFFTVQVLLIFYITISHLGYACKNIRTECTKGSHTGSHKISPSSTWDFPRSLYHRIISSHLTLQLPFPKRILSKASQEWNTKVFPEQGRDFRYLRLTSLVGAICNHRKESTVRNGLFCILHNGLAFSGWLRERRAYSSTGAPNDPRRDGASLSCTVLPNFTNTASTQILNRLGNAISVGTALMIQFNGSDDVNDTKELDTHWQENHLNSTKETVFQRITYTEPKQSCISIADTQRCAYGMSGFWNRYAIWEV